MMQRLKRLKPRLVARVAQRGDDFS